MIMRVFGAIAETIRSHIEKKEIQEGAPI